MALDHPMPPPAAGGVAQAPAAQEPPAVKRTELQKRATIALVFLAGVTFLYPSVVAAVFYVCMISGDVAVAYRPLRFVGLMDQLGWLTNYWSSLPAILAGAAASMATQRRVSLAVVFTFLLVAAFGSLWLGWMSGVPGSRIRGLFSVIPNVHMPTLLAAIDQLKSLVEQTRDLAVLAISGGLGVAGAATAQKQLSKRF